MGKYEIFRHELKILVRRLIVVEGKFLSTLLGTMSGPAAFLTFSASMTATVCSNEMLFREFAPFKPRNLMIEPLTLSSCSEDSLDVVRWALWKFLASALAFSLSE